jgi:hypothetical protein
MSQHPYDGKTLWLSVLVSLNDPRYVFTTDTVQLDAREAIGDPQIPAGQTIGAWAAENDRIPLHPMVWGDSASFSYHRQFLDDKTMTFLLTCGDMEAEPNEEFSLTCALEPFVEQDGVFPGQIDTAHRKESSLTFTLSEVQPLASVTNTQPIEFTAAGIVVDKLELSSSSLSAYCDIEFTGADAETFDLFFRILDSNGEEYGSGLGGSTGSGIRLIPNTEGRHRQRSDIQALEELPASIQLQLIDLANNKQVIETKTVELS